MGARGAPETRQVSDNPDRQERGIPHTRTEQSVGTMSILELLDDILGPDATHATLAGTGDETPPPSLERSKEKYQSAGEIGRGGMGVVVKAFDNDLRRWVAMKVIREDTAQQNEKLSRFIEEAQICGQLEHPHIPPVHEMGIGADGRVFFTMKLVKGRTLREIAKHLSLGRPDVRREFTPIRLAQILQQSAMGVHYANVRGVIHRDLKPENIMVGDYGEVLVMDWGLAKVVTKQALESQHSGEDPVATARAESGIQTMAGAVQGTPSYMPPEQANGVISALDGRTDVFGLGASLYECLCFRPPYTGTTVGDILEQARRGRVQPPSQIATAGSVPPDLEAICMKALAENPNDRHESARAFGQDLQEYIEGTRDKERRRGQAMRLVDKGVEHIGKYNLHEARRERLEADAERASEEIAPHEPVEKKRLLWRIQDGIDKLRSEATGEFSAALAALNAAVQTDQKCSEAKQALADLYWQRFSRAEAERNHTEANLFRDLLEAHDDGRYADRLKGDGTLSVETEPPGADAVLYQYEKKERRLVPIQHRTLGTTPCVEIPLAMGSYLLVLRLDGHREVRYPVVIGRSEEHHANVRLRPENDIGEDFVYVPASTFEYGGDPESYGGDRQSRPAIGDFFIQRFPVSMQEYCEFLTDFRKRGNEVDEHVPRQANELFVEWDGEAYRPIADLVEGETVEFHEPGFELRCPVFGVNWDSAQAYCAWRSERDGCSYELPTEQVWEKAARGVDGRCFPWGDDFDWTFTKGGLSRAGVEQPEPVGTFPDDCSPYGVRDLVGTIREWTQSWFDENAGTRALRGGSWNLVVSRHFHCATRFGYAPSARVSTFGFRLMRWAE